MFVAAAVFGRVLGRKQAGNERAADVVDPDGVVEHLRRVCVVNQNVTAQLFEQMYFTLLYVGRHGGDLFCDGFELGIDIFQLIPSVGIQGSSAQAGEDDSWLRLNSWGLSLFFDVVNVPDLKRWLACNASLQ